MSLCHHPYKSVAFVLAIGALGALSLVPVSAQKKGKPSSPPDATADVALSDDVGFAMVSDGGGPYAGATIFGASGDLRLDVGASGRAIQVDLGEPDAVGLNVTDAPNGVTYLTDGVLIVQDVRSVAAGTPEMRVGRIGLRSAYPNHAVGFRATTVGGIEIYGTPVCVTRLDNRTWSIASSCSEYPDDTDTAGLFEENLKGKISVRFKANYSVPFAATVTCRVNCP